MVGSNGSTGEIDLQALSKDLASAPCGPLYRSHVFPYVALHALVAGLGGSSKSLR